MTECRVHMETALPPCAFNSLMLRKHLSACHLAALHSWEFDAQISFDDGEPFSSCDSNHRRFRRFGEMGMFRVNQVQGLGWLLWPRYQRKSRRVGGPQLQGSKSQDGGLLRLDRLQLRNRS